MHRFADDGQGKSVCSMPPLHFRRLRCVSLALADAEELHKKIERLRDRCAKLEDGLRTLQAAVTDEPHPLLREDSSSDACAVGSS